MSETSDDIIKVVATFGLLGAAFGFIIGTSASHFIRSVTENFVLPVLGAFFNVGDLQSATFQLNGSRVKIGEMFLSFLDLVLVLLVVYILYRLFKPHITAVSEEKGRTQQKLIEQNEEIIKHLKRFNNEGSFPQTPVF